MYAEIKRGIPNGDLTVSRIEEIKVDTRSFKVIVRETQVIVEVGSTQYRLDFHTRCDSPSPTEP